MTHSWSWLVWSVSCIWGRRRQSFRNCSGLIADLSYLCTYFCTLARCLFISFICFNIRVWNQSHNTHHTYRFVQRQWDLSCFGPLLPYLTDKGKILWYKFWHQFWFMSNVHLGKREHHLMIWWCAWFPCAVVALLDMLLLSWESYAYFEVNKRGSVGFITKPRMTHKNLPSFTEPSINIAGMFQSYHLF